MPFVSTQNPDGTRYGLAEALRLGPAPDGGLFMPERIEPLDPSFLDTLAERSLTDIGTAVMDRLVGEDLDRSTIEEISKSALDFPIPLVRVSERIRVLEIFHGPTLAFKDVGARFLARLLAATRSESAPGREESTVLVATSGDTGGAVARAFHGVEGTRVAILYPAGKVSPVQERQFTTLGDNIRAFAVDGVFDDCQRLVNEAFADRELAQSLSLTSANSINVGRLLPQAIYYFHAAAQESASRSKASESRKPLVFCTPSGNFGNLTAGFLAQRLGLEARFLAATNANDVVPSYLETGVYEPRSSLRTISNAMDVGRPNNFVRILHLHGHDFERLKSRLGGYRFDDEATARTIGRVEREQGYLLDPHTAVGWLAVEEEFARDGDDDAEVGIVLGTAHPAKFGEVVAPILGRELELPENLARHLHADVKSEPLEARLEELRRRLLAW